MSVTIFSNDIPIPELRDSIGKAVLDGIGQRPDNEQWRGSIYAPQTSAHYIVVIEGPNDFKWERSFSGPDERSPELIREEVRQAIHTT